MQSRSSSSLSLQHLHRAIELLDPVLLVLDLVLVLTCDNTTLFDRLTKRGYASSKVSENVEAEIMQVVLQEARDSYASEILHILSSVNIDEMDSNLSRAVEWISSWGDGCSRE